MAQNKHMLNQGGTHAHPGRRSASFASPVLWRVVILLNFCLFFGVPELPAQTTKAPAPVPAPKPAAPLEGTYTGSLQAGDAQIHLVLHLSHDSHGELHATLDSLDQGVFAIETSSISLTAGTLRFEIASVGAQFEGKVSLDHKIIDGSWSQGTASLPLSFHREPPAHKPEGAVSPVEGLWQSALETHGMRLRYQLHVSHDSDGQLIAALDSLDQSVVGLPAVNVDEEKSSFHFEIPSMNSSYEGTLSADKNTISGTWSQNYDSAKIEFKRSDQPLELRRPQNPIKPYPYREEEVSFSNAPANVTLAGTLTLPKGSGPFPAAVLIAGSGPHDRDESLENHKPFLVLSDFLTRQGIAVLRYDKRGIGKSTGSADSATTLDLAGDAASAVAYLKTRKEIDATRIGLIGHSEGALIAPYLASQSTDVPWIILLAAPATKGQDTLLNQSELVGRASGLDDAEVVGSLAFDRNAYDFVREEKDPAALTEKLKNLVKVSGLNGVIPPTVLETQLRMLTSPWFRFFLDYDPVPVLQKTKCPVLALYGQKDLQVPSKNNLPLLQKALQDADNKQAEIHQLADLNHLFQHAYSGSPAEYGAIEETFAPEALQIISEWLQPRITTKSASATAN
jgi:pimeloyl-ACP methyl ester carboxylesterase